MYLYDYQPTTTTRWVSTRPAIFIHFLEVPRFSPTFPLSLIIDERYL